MGPPTPTPSFTATPSTSSAPTGEPEQAAVWGKLRVLINALAAASGSLVLQVMNDMSCPQEILLSGDRSVRAFGDAAASRPALSGGGATRIFAVEYGALLELDHIALTTPAAVRSASTWRQSEENGKLRAELARRPLE